MADRNINEQYVAKEQFAHWRRFAILGYIVLALAAAVGVWSVTNKTDEDIRADISIVSETTCSEILIPAVKNFNYLLREVSITATQIGNEDAVKRYKDLELKEPTLEECKQNLMVR